MHLKDDMSIIKNEEDREFPRTQREDVFSYSMSGTHLLTTSKQMRQRRFEDKKRIAKSRYEERNAQSKMVASAEVDNSSSSPESQSED